MSTTENFFSAGDSVTFDMVSSQYFYIHKEHVKLYGDGIITVVRVSDMPPDLLKSEKHKQWVYVKTLGGGVKCVSGFWLKKA